MKNQKVDNRGYFLGVDIGNTHSVIGLFEAKLLIDSWRIQTRPEATGDELRALLSSFLQEHALNIHDIETVVMSSVVPPAAETWTDMADKQPGLTCIDAHQMAMHIINIKYPRPHEIGTDRLINSIAAFKRLERACIVIDYGTATTFDCVSENGEYLGGAIAPGLLLAAKTLFTNTSKLPMIHFPKDKIGPLGTSTETAMQAGLLYGFAGLTDNIVSRLSRTFGQDPAVIATGGLSSVLFQYCNTIDELLPELTMEGLAHCYEYYRSQCGLQGIHK